MPPQHRMIKLDMAEGAPLKIRKLLQDIRGDDDLHEIGMTITRNHCRHVVKFDNGHE
jgi:hypothetical protein